MEIFDEEDEEVKRLMLRISRKEITLCDSCDAFFDYIPQVTTCDECKKKKYREYYQCPEYKAKKREYNQRPEVKARAREYEQRPEYKAKKREYNQRPEVKARARERYLRKKKLREEE